MTKLSPRDLDDICRIAKRHKIVYNQKNTAGFKVFVSFGCVEN